MVGAAILCFLFGLGLMYFFAGTYAIGGSGKPASQALLVEWFLIAWGIFIGLIIFSGQNIRIIGPVSILGVFLIWMFWNSSISVFYAVIFSVFVTAINGLAALFWKKANFWQA